MSPLAPVSPQSLHSAPVLSQPPSLSHIPLPQPLKTHAYLSQLPAAIPISHFLPDEPPSNVYPSNVNVLGSFMRRSSWFHLQCGCCDFGVDQGYLPFRPIATPQLLSPSFRCSGFPLHPHFRVITLSESVLLGRCRFWGFLPYLCEYWSVGLFFCSQLLI